MEQTTHRQYLVWVEWFNLLWNRPERDTYYLMQIASEIRRCSLVNQQNTKLDSMKIEFETKKKEEATTQQNGLTKEQLLAAQKAVWLGRVNVPSQRKK